MAQMGFFDADKRLAALTLAALEHAELPGDPYGPRLLQPFLAILQTLVGFPMHALRLGRQRLVIRRRGCAQSSPGGARMCRRRGAI